MPGELSDAAVACRGQDILSQHSETADGVTCFTEWQRGGREIFFTSEMAAYLVEKHYVD